jgi:hypothetical protein
VNRENLSLVRPGIVRFWAWLDFGFGLAMAIPPLAYGFAKLIFAVNHLIGGTVSMPEFAPVQWLTVFVCGVFILNWGAIRLLYPSGLFALIDSALKLWIGALLVYVIVDMEAPHVLWIFVGNAVLGAGTQLAAVYWRPLHRPPGSK